MQRKRLRQEFGKFFCKYLQIRQIIDLIGICFEQKMKIIVGAFIRVDELTFESQEKMCATCDA